MEAPSKRIIQRGVLGWESFEYLLGIILFKQHCVKSKFDVA
jgi:hypothetical protein